MIIFLLELAFLNKSFNHFEFFNPCSIIHIIHVTSDVKTYHVVKNL